MEDGKSSGLAEVLAENAEGILVGVLAVAVLAAIVVGGCYAFYFWGVPLSGDPGSWGQLGDYLGGVLNPVFGFLSVFALLVALVLQTRELKLSRESLKLSQEELRLSREEQAKSAEALSLQNKAIHKQSFEQTFFSMLRLLEEVVASSRDGQPPNDVVGRAAISKSLKFAFADIIYRDMYDNSPNMQRPYPEAVKGCVDALNKWDEQGHFKRYLRVLSSILENLKDANIEPSEIYPRTFKSLLSQDELKLIYFACFDEEWTRLKSLVEYYGVLRHLRGEGTGAPADYFSFFGREAFAE